MQINDYYMYDEKYLRFHEINNGGYFEYIYLDIYLTYSIQPIDH